MFFAYVKLVPMSADEVNQLVADREDSSTRKLVVSIDGASFLHLCEFSRPTDFSLLLNLIAIPKWGESFGRSVTGAYQLSHEG